MFNLFKKKRSVPSGDPVKVDLSSQPNVLKDRMQRANMTHDETILADIPNVRIRSEVGIPVMYFCDSRDIVVKERISKGDGGAIPNDLVLEKINMPKGFMKDGWYTLKNVKIHSNGTMQVIATAATKFELVHKV